MIIGNLTRVVIQATQGNDGVAGLFSQSWHAGTADPAKGRRICLCFWYLVGDEQILAPEKPDRIDRGKAVGRMSRGPRLAATGAVAIMDHLEWSAYLERDAVA